jgi:hypothetical protein
MFTEKNENIIERFLFPKSLVAHLLSNRKETLKQNYLTMKIILAYTINSVMLRLFGYQPYPKMKMPVRPNRNVRTIQPEDELTFNRWNNYINSLLNSKLQK